MGSRAIPSFMIRLRPDTDERALALLRVFFWGFANEKVRVCRLLHPIDLCNRDWKDPLIYLFIALITTYL